MKSTLLEIADLYERENNYNQLSSIFRNMHGSTTSTQNHTYIPWHDQQKFNLIMVIDPEGVSRLKSYIVNWSRKDRFPHLIREE